MEAKKYNPQEIEAKWQEVWEKEKLYATPEVRSKAKGLRSKKYVLDMYPYPSGFGLHVGHIEGYTGTDIVSRYLRMKGHAVLHPMGWDAFGLPAENYAIKEGILPDKSTHDNIANFTSQIKRAGLSYDWEREIDSSSPNYYKYTQWIFIQLFKAGLAYKKKAPANWCPKDETVLANEQVVDGKCERCGTEVVQKELEQWFFKITEYADRLIDGLKQIDWPRSTKIAQENWIGRKEGVEITCQVVGVNDTITVFTTAPVNFGMTFLVLAPEHKFVRKIISGQIAVPEMNLKEVKDYVETANKKKELERLAEGREKTGVFTGLYALNQVTGKQVPVWVTDFVLGYVGTGAVQGCPGHDLKDWQFAKKFGLPIVRVVKGPDGYEGPVEREDQIIEKGMKGWFVNSEFLNGLSFEEGLSKTMDYFEDKGWGKRVVTYHLRDWLVSRQRYWGAPIPMVFCEKDGWQPVPDTELPVLLPTDVDFLPHGESPIATSKTFQKGVKCPVCGGSARREVDTMDTFVDSSWYFWAFTFAHKELMRGSKLKNKAAKNVFAEFKDDVKTCSPVDLYVGGAEHTVLHLMYSRFFWKAFLDLGLLDKSLGGEPFLKLRHQGTVLGPDGRRMAKRWGNIINPTDVADQFGADTLRIYEMFMGPFEAMKPWNINSVAGVYRFLSRIYNRAQGNISKDTKTDQGLRTQLAKTVLKVSADIENLKFNTAVAAMMEYLNQVEASKNQVKAGMGRQDWETFLKILAPFAPHLAEELWAQLGHKKSIHTESWPEVEEKYLASDKVTIVVSVNGKARATISVNSEQSAVNSQSEIEKMAKADPRVGKWLEGEEIKKVIYVPGKIVNFVV